MKLDVLRQIRFRLASDIYPAALVTHVSNVIKRVVPFSRPSDPAKVSGGDAMVPAVSNGLFIVLAIIIFFLGVVTGCLFLIF